MKRLISLVLVLTMVLGMVPTAAFAAETPSETKGEIAEVIDETVAEETVEEITTAEPEPLLAGGSVVAGGICGDNLTWELVNDGTLTISGTGKMADFSEGYGLTVTYEIPWEEYFDSITAVIVQDGVTSISNNAFSKCANLKKIVLPSSVDYIDASISRSGASVVDGSPFFDCKGITTAGPIGSGCDYEFAWTTEIPQYAFAGLTGLQSVMLPQTITTIGYGAFEVSAVKSITIPASVASIESYAFHRCKIENITFRSKATTVGLFAFYRCNYLSDVYFPGTETDWEKFAKENISTASDHGLMGNQALLDATVHTAMSITASGTCGANVTWTFSEETGLLTIGGSGEMTDYHSGPVGYSPEPYPAPWHDYYYQIESVVIEPGVTHIGSYSLTGYKLTEVSIPDTVESISHYAFEYCDKLSDVYYTGSQEEWNEVAISETGNYPLLNSTSVTIHYNWTGITEEPVYLASVLYYHSWEEASGKIFFGADGEISFLVTEETNVGSIEDAWLGKYVIVQTKTEGNNEILLNLKLPETGVGTVTAVNKSQITIDGENYTTPKDLSSRESYLNKQVVYHVYSGNLVGIEILQKKQGYLTHWHSGGRLLRIHPEADSSEYKFYHLSYLAEDDSEIFLSLAINESGQTDVTVNYLVDSNRMVYHIEPVVMRRANGFSAEKHGWPIINHRDSFGYKEGYEYDWLTYYTHGVGIDIFNYFPHKPNYSGNCFGLSLLAIAQYNRQVDLKPYFSTDGDTLNEFGYDSIQIIKDDGNGFALHRYDENGKEIYHNDVIQKIEQAQGSQGSLEVLATKKSYSVEELLSYLNENNPKPLVVSMNRIDFSDPWGHAVAIDTSIKPIYIGCGRYLIPLYDSNAPSAPTELDNISDGYTRHQSVLLLDVETNEWYYLCDNEQVFGKKGSITCYNISKLDQSFFDDHYKFKIKPDKTIIIFDSDEVIIEYIESGEGTETKVFEIVDYKTWMNEQFNNIEYLPFIADSAAMDSKTEETMQGCVILPKGNYIVKTKGESYVQYMYDDDIFVYSSNQDMEAMVDSQKDEMTVRNTAAETDVKCIYASAEIDYCTGVEAKLRSEKMVSLRTSSENKTASVSTNADVGTVKVTYVVNGEEVEDTSNMIHYHENLTHVEGFEATCTQRGQTDYYVCECGKIFADVNAYTVITSVEVPALGHSYENGKCIRCGQKSTEAMKRLAGDSRYETSFAIATEMKKVLGIDKFNTIVLANSDNFADALAGSYLAAVKNAPIIIAKQKYAGIVCDYLNENLAVGATVYILGGTDVMPDEILSGLNITVTRKRLEGDDRYLTNLEILKHIPIGNSDVLVATGRDFADSLSASATGLPILLVNGKPGKTLSAEQKNFLASVEGKIYIIGGESAVPASVVQQIEAASNKKTERIAGGSRYETSIEIAKQFLPEADSAVVAYASTFPDGLCGGPLAYAVGAPLILTKDGKSEAPDYTTGNNITSGYVLGGDGLISDDFAKTIFQVTESLK